MSATRSPGSSRRSTARRIARPAWSSTQTSRHASAAGVLSARRRRLRGGGGGGAGGGGGRLGRRGGRLVEQPVGAERRARLLHAGWRRAQAGAGEEASAG